MTRRLRRVWSPDEREIAVMKALAELADNQECTITHADLATHLNVPVTTLTRSMRWLEAFGYLKREPRAPISERGGFASPIGRLDSRYTIIKMPTVDDKHDIGAYPTGRGDSYGGAGVRRRDDIDPDEVIRLYHEEKLSIRAIANRFHASYGTIHRIVSKRSTPRPRGGTYGQ